jgi:hypothetical protein
MIRALDDMPAGVLGFEASGKLGPHDYTDVLGPAIDAVTAGGGKLHVVLVIGPDFDGMEAGAVWQDLRLGVHEWSAWERLALVTDHRWMRDGLKMFAWAVPGDVKDFGLDERDAAVAWVAALPDGPNH